MATEVSAPPNMAQLQSVQKVMALPSVGAAVGQVGAFYTKVKGAHSLLEWALSTAEASVTLAAATAVPYVAAPLAAGDARVAAAIDELERRVPLVTEQPKVIVETTKQAVLSRISPHVNKVCVARAAAEQRVHSLKELSWAKANALLSTAYGQKAMHGIDTGATYAMQLLDQYLPPVGSQPEPTDSANNISLGSLAERSHAKANALLSTEYGQRALHGLDIGAIYVMQLLDQYLPPVEPQPEPTGEITTATTDPTLHTVQTVGRLSAVAARRVWANLAYKVNELRANGIELDVRRYVTALMAALHLAQVTSEQQRAEAAQAQGQGQAQAQGHAPPLRAEPAPPAPQPQPAPVAAPTTANKVKTTPEAKSDISEPNKQ